MKKFIYISIILILSSCGSSDDNMPSGDGYDRSNLLTNIYDNIIIPSYEVFYNDIQLLENNVTALISNPNPSQFELDEVRSSWELAYKSWQSVEMFNLRKAEELSYSSIMNAYPCIEINIEDYMSDSVFEISSFTPSLLGATGFPAVGYMIYAKESSLLHGGGPNEATTYLNALVQNMKNNTELVYNDWLSARSEFISSTANTRTSSLNIILNEFVKYFEKKVRTSKIANPINYFGDQQPDPTQVESYYKRDLCKPLLMEAFSSVKRFYNGESRLGVNGEGLSDYLGFLDRQELDLTINNQFINIEQNIELLDNDFVAQLDLDGATGQLRSTFLSMQNLVTYFKTDMLVVSFGIELDYQDNDGDGG